LVFADRNKVKRVFLNLVNNAIQAFPCGEKVSVRTFAEKGAAVFQVIDRGCGIEPEHLESVFHPFFTTKKSGTGLGLGIAKKIVEAHGGKISFRLNRDKGVTFTVALSWKALNRPYQETGPEDEGKEKEGGESSRASKET